MENVLRSPEINLLAGALAKAQGEMLAPQKRRTATVKMKEGGTYTYKYADLSDIREAVTPALSKNALAIMQLIDAGTCRLTTVVVHETGQYMGSTYDLPRGLPAQQFGSALTYAKRYSLCSLLNVVAEEDDDGAGAQDPMKRQQKVAKTAPVVKPKGEQVINETSGPNLGSPPKAMSREEIMKRISETFHPLTTLDPNLDLAAEIFSRYGATNRKDLSDSEAWDFLQWMETKLREGVTA